MSIILFSIYAHILYIDVVLTGRLEKRDDDEKLKYRLSLS